VTAMHASKAIAKTAPAKIVNVQVVAVAKAII
jgi:hypothetical protein